MSLSTYLYFDGSCAEAFNHYKRVFDAEEQCRQYYSEGPIEIFGESNPDWIMHTTLVIGGNTLFGADRVPSADQPLKAGNNFAVMFRAVSKESADRILAALAIGGSITMPMQETFWGSYFGTCTDRFGINWIFNHPLSAH